MRGLAERVYFGVCRALGRLLRAGRYARVRIACGDGERRVRKRRRLYAPLLVWMGGPLVRLLDTGVRVLPQREWAERERALYRILGRPPIRTEADGTLVLPCLAGATLASLLDDPQREEPVRRRAIALAVSALADFHRLGLTHGDAMAENVLVDLEAGVAHWFDFETVHDPARSPAWRRADDLRALLFTCLLRTAARHRAGTLQLVLDVHGDEGVARVLATSVAPVVRRPLAFHLGQAAVSFHAAREIARLLRERVGG